MIVRSTKSFRKSLERAIGSGRHTRREIYAIVSMLEQGEGLLERHRDHALKGEYAGYRECHIKPDLLLIYRIEDGNLVLVLIDIGSHTYLFD